MLASNKIIGFVSIKDSQKSRTFYEEKLGLNFVSDDPFAMVFQAGGTMIRLSKVQDFTPQPFTVLGWETKDIQKTATDLKERGINFERFEGLEQNNLGIWSAPSGAKVAWFKDPDGNVLSVSQH